MTPVATALRGAVDRGEIAAWFQPQLDLRTGRIVGAEALCRWTHPRFGAVAPSDFIPLAEEFGLIDEIGLFMAAEACRAAEEWSRRDDPVEVSVNVSPIQLLTSAFTEFLADRFARLALPPLSLTIEITESVRIQDFPSVVRRLDELRSLGIGISLDDFGTGHSSITQARRMHATELKIDRSLVTDDSPASTAMLASVIAEVREAGMRVVAEGVETAVHLQRVRDLECDRAQGYLIGRPTTKVDVVALLP